MNNRKALLTTFVQKFPDVTNYLYKHYRNYLRDELIKYIAVLPNDKTKVVTNYLNIITNTKTYTSKERKQLNKLRPQIIEIINDRDLPDNYTYDLSDDSCTSSNEDEDTIPNDTNYQTTKLKNETIDKEIQLAQIQLSIENARALSHILPKFN